MKLEYVVVQDMEGWYIASVPTLPGCFTVTKELGDIEARLVEAVSYHASEAAATGVALKFIEMRQLSL